MSAKIEIVSLFSIIALNIFPFSNAVGKSKSSDFEKSPSSKISPKSSGINASESLSPGLDGREVAAERKSKTKKNQTTAVATSDSASSQRSDFKERFNRALKNFETKSEEAVVKMTIIEADSSTKDREVAVRRIGLPEEQRVMVRILAPADLKGMSLFSTIDKSTENQWIYFPSSKQTRKIVTSDQSDSGILGSELKYDDFNPTIIRKSKAELLKTEACGTSQCDVVEAKPNTGSTPYSRVIVLIDRAQDLPLEMSYFIGDEKVKTVEFKDFKKIGKVLRPHSIIIRNLQNKRGTDISISSLKVNSNIKSEQMTVQQISRPW